MPAPILRPYRGCVQTILSRRHVYRSVMVAAGGGGGCGWVLKRRTDCPTSERTSSDDRECRARGRRRLSCDGDVPRRGAVVPVRSSVEFLLPGATQGMRCAI